VHLPKISLADGRVHVGTKSFAVPESRAMRIGAGIALVLGGTLGGFLPVLGYWMIPLGLVFLSFDVPLFARWREKAFAWWNGRIASKRPHRAG
jgi:hypothetical protein